MALFCLPKKFVDVVRNSVLAKETDLEALYTMTSKERREFFTQYTNAEAAKFLNTKFEEAIISKQEDAILSWAESVFTPKQKVTPQYKTVLEKINNLSEQGILSDKAEYAFLEDLVTEQLGVTVTPEEMQEIIKLSETIEEKQKALGNNLGNPAYLEEQIQFLNAIKDMNEYLQERNPAHALAVLTATIGRGMMLFSLKSSLLNIVSNTNVGIAEGLLRRLSTKAWKGTNNELAKSYVAMARTIYKETGFDISRMMHMNDLGAAGERVLGKGVHSQGEGAIRKGGRIIEDIVFKNLMGAPDAFFASVAFIDSVNVESLRVADGDIVKAEEVMNDAMKIVPETKMGELVRAKGILDAQTATFTDETWASRFAENIRKNFNDATGNYRLGDYLFPFVKTTANVSALGLDYAGLGIPKALMTFANMVRTKNIGNKAQLLSISRDLTRSGLGLLGAFMLAWNTDDDDFVGAWDPKRAQIEGLRNSVENSFRIGGQWISVDWLGPLSVPYSAMMYAKKYGKAGAAESAFQYGMGMGGQVLKLPGIKDIMDFGVEAARKQNSSLEEMTGEAGDYIVSQMSARLIPSIIGDLAQLTDGKQRKTKNALEALQAKLPLVRSLLPQKVSVFGEELTTEPLQILFGSRVKTSKEDATISELVRVINDSGKSISFTDWSKSTSKKLAQFRDKVGDEKYKEASIYYGKTLKADIDKTINSSSYKKMTADEQVTLLNNLDTAAQMKTFGKYSFSYRTEKK